MHRIRIYDLERAPGQREVLNIRADKANMLKLREIYSTPNYIWLM